MAATELERLDAVKRFDTFDFNLNANLKGILKLASFIYETPVAFISLMDEHVQLFKVCHGFQVSLMPRATSFCTYAIMQDTAMVINDANADVRFSDNPLVANPPNIRFYAGSPLATIDGMNVGTLCVMDTAVKEVTDEKREMMNILAKQAINIMELEVAYKLLKKQTEDILHRDRLLSNIAFIQAHEVRAPLCNIMGIMNIIKDDNYESPRDYLLMMEDAVEQLDNKIRKIVNSTQLNAEIALG